jgi:hypothetical protein
MNRPRISVCPRWGLFAAWTLFILACTLGSPTPWYRTFGYLLTLVHTGNIPDGGPAKAYHFVAYGVWVFLFIGAWRGSYAERLPRYTLLNVVTPGLVMFASAQESLQLVSPFHRTASVWDVFLNCAGGIAALMVYELGGLCVAFIRCGGEAAKKHLWPLRIDIEPADLDDLLMTNR